MTDVHIINHTHWDREWFLTHEYTTAWVGPLIDSLEELAAANPEYEFLLDGQTLAIEDLLNTSPTYRSQVQKLISGGQLSIGPCYSQPDWRMTSGELLLRNLQLGLDDARSHGGSPDVAWLVDTFGHVSQAPQMLRLVGIDAAYVWRGVPEMTPLFRWKGADASEVAGIDLFGGYRNLYGISKTEEIAVERLVTEADKLAASYGDLPVPLFDGYDLDTEPEDPVRYYEDRDIPGHLQVHASSPRRYADAILPHLVGAPVIEGELISGKYGSTFPGSLSSRAYLKMLHHDAERALHRRVEPLMTMALLRGAEVDASIVEAKDRELLQNAVHDCICGVSIDQVHERMERSYRRMLGWADEQQQALSNKVLAGFAPGTYAISTHAMTITSVLRTAYHAFEVHSEGIGIAPVARTHSVRSVNEAGSSFDWANDHYQATVDGGGLRLHGIGQLARLVVTADEGDTYSSEPAEVLGELTMVGQPIKLDESAIDTTIRTTWKLTSGGIDVAATVDARFDAGPVVELRIELDSTGTGFRVDAEFDTAVETDTVHASMPFDVVERAHDDPDLLPFTIDPALAKVLMGQRETGRVTEFPFHDFVSYQSDAHGKLTLTLRRAAEWLALTGLKLRSGDAGPAMYVPGARSERTVVHRLAFATLAGGLADSGLITHNEAFHNPPMISHVRGGAVDGSTLWNLFSAEAPVAAMPVLNGTPAVRLFNSLTSSLATSVDLLSPAGEPEGQVSSLRPKQIVTAGLPTSTQAWVAAEADTVVLTPIEMRVGASRSKPVDEELEGLEQRIADLAAQLVDNTEQLDGAEGDDKYRLMHREYVLDRERLELALSLELNRRLAASTDEVSIPDDADPVIADLGLRLNDLRVRRRIFDYVVAAL